MYEIIIPISIAGMSLVLAIHNIRQIKKQKAKNRENTLFLGQEILTLYSKKLSKSEITQIKNQITEIESHIDRLYKQSGDKT